MITYFTFHAEIKCKHIKNLYEEGFSYVIIKKRIPPSMERYHIFKLGLAILFYAAYCFRPMLVYGLKADDNLEQNRKIQNANNDYFQYLQGIEGKPKRDYPAYSYIPRTSFSCRGIKSGYYADLETECQVFHICEDGRKISFLCPNGTIFQQKELICEWWNKVNCTNSPNLYEESAEKLQNDIARRKASRKNDSLNVEFNHGAVMRTEERVSTRSRYNRPSQTKNTNRIPNNNDIEQHIEQAESNNRHLANAQRNLNQIYQSERTSKSKQTKKDIEQETGNFGTNNNYDTEQNRQIKKIDVNSKNDFSFGEKIGNSGTSFRGSTKYTTKNKEERVTEERNSFSTQRTKIYNHNYFSTSEDTLEDGSNNNKPKTQQNTNFGKNNFNSNVNSGVPNNINHYSSTRSPADSSYSRNLETSNNNYLSPTSTESSNPNIVSTYHTASSSTYKPQYQQNYGSSKAPNYEVPPSTHRSVVSTPRSVNQASYNSFQNQIPVKIINDETAQRKNFETESNNSQELETQVPEESSSFVKNSFNSIRDGTYKTSSGISNHRSTYSDVKDLSFLEAPKVSAISSITPHLVTTQPINSGKPFVGSRIGTTLLPNQPTTQSKYTYLPKNDNKDLFNLGSTDKTLPPIYTTTALTNPIPTEPFNLGNTDSTLSTNVPLNYHTTTYKPLDLPVPEQGSFNTGPREPVYEPPFIKKTVPLLYQSNSTEAPSNQATVYGTFVSTNTPYSPTVPTVTPSNSFYPSTNHGIPIRFEKGQDKVSVQLSKNIFGERQPIKTSGDEYVRFNTQVRVRGDGSSTTPASSTQQNGFFLTRDYNSGFNSPIQRAKAFEKSNDFVQDINKINLNQNQKTKPVFPSYEISSPRPFGTQQGPTDPTPYTTTGSPPTSGNVYDNLDNMIGVLQEIASYNTAQNNEVPSRSGLVIPPSVGPQTLHSLAQYFANEVGENEAELEGDAKERLTGLLTAMTVHGYNNLFNSESTSTTTSPTTSSASTTILTDSRIGNDNIQTNTAQVTEPTNVNENDLLSTTALPELRQLARNFSLALSSYLNNPENFRKTLESFRPTEPPPLEANADEEILNFSDQDIKPSTSTFAPSPTWGFIVASGGDKSVSEEVKNSLNPDLNTADSQSFVPRFNAVNVAEKQPQSRSSFTDLPPGHWTTSPRATTLWQKTLSINPAILNDNLDSSTQLPSDDGQTEPELYNQETFNTNIGQPHSEINYELRELPSLSLNSTQVHGILIDFMNTSKQDEHNRLHRILKKLNTSEEEFLNKMKEIESNPLTKRLILLLISECGSDLSKDLKNSEVSSPVVPSNSEVKRENHNLDRLVHEDLKEDRQDARALQLLNSLYHIASRFGKKR
ncbi:probable serine/threonine-protein kinase DDB_G0282963 isoform X2 [Sitophilus oryzae]|uniref:Probable serine/threonine-protein kinase DDB_G0282963 isoform X2 n=1 Tax=Sitophilus oryzae TaxID=7048 RepID=A0A6J2Y3W2_SITOR|nr:probable serine/threonine-protein kinase DDB_G0282963 isoform X2 [Sitophilus oryzae]